MKDLSFGFISYVKATCSWTIKWIGFIALGYYTVKYFSLGFSSEGIIESRLGKLCQGVCVVLPLTGKELETNSLLYIQVCLGLVHMNAILALLIGLDYNNKEIGRKWVV